MLDAQHIWVPTPDAPVFRGRRIRRQQSGDADSLNAEAESRDHAEGDGLFHTPIACPKQGVAQLSLLQAMSSDEAGLHSQAQHEERSDMASNP
jgi:hypothetical protein